MAQPTVRPVLFIGMVEFVSTKTGKVVTGPLYCCTLIAGGQVAKGGLYADTNLDNVLKRARSVLDAKAAVKAVFDAPGGFNKNSAGTRLYKFAELSYDDFNTAQRVLSG